MVGDSDGGGELIEDGVMEGDGVKLSDGVDDSTVDGGKAGVQVLCD